MAENKEDSRQQPKNPLAMFPKIELKIPFFNQQGRRAGEAEAAATSANKHEAKTTTSVVIGEGDNEDGSTQKRNVVSFPKPQPFAPSPLAMEFEESSGTTHNPFIIWQVYALGGFIILKWVWARWQERKERAKKASSSEGGDQSPSPSSDDES